MMVGMSDTDKIRLEAIWHNNDLKQLGVDEKLLDTDTCVRIDQIIEATPVGIRAIAGTGFHTDLISANVTPIPEQPASSFTRWPDLVQKQWHRLCVTVYGQIATDAVRHFSRWLFHIRPAGSAH